jgi:hypothetical protein
VASSEKKVPSTGCILKKESSFDWSQHQKRKFLQLVAFLGKKVLSTGCILRKESSFNCRTLRKESSYTLVTNGIIRKDHLFQFITIALPDLTLEVYSNLKPLFCVDPLV